MKKIDRFLSRHRDLILLIICVFVLTDNITDLVAGDLGFWNVFFTIWFTFMTVWSFIALVYEDFAAGAYNRSR